MVGSASISFADREARRAALLPVASPRCARNRQRRIARRARRAERRVVSVERALAASRGSDCCSPCSCPASATPSTAARAGSRSARARAGVGAREGVSSALSCELRRAALARAFRTSFGVRQADAVRRRRRRSLAARARFRCRRRAHCDELGRAVRRRCTPAGLSARRRRGRRGARRGRVLIGVSRAAAHDVF